MEPSIELTTDICRNETNRCYEAWIADRATGRRRLLSTCSMCVPEEQYQAWRQQVGQPGLAA